MRTIAPADLVTACTSALDEWADLQVLDGTHPSVEDAIASETGEAIVNVLHRTANRLGVFIP